MQARPNNTVAEKFSEYKSKVFKLMGEGTIFLKLEDLREYIELFIREGVGMVEENPELTDSCLSFIKDIEKVAKKIDEEASTPINAANRVKNFKQLINDLKVKELINNFPAGALKDALIDGRIDKTMAIKYYDKLIKLAKIGVLTQTNFPDFEYQLTSLIKNHKTKNHEETQLQIDALAIIAEESMKYDPVIAQQCYKLIEKFNEMPDDLLLINFRGNADYFANLYSPAKEDPKHEARHEARERIHKLHTILNDNAKDSEVIEKIAVFNKQILLSQENNALPLSAVETQICIELLQRKIKTTKSLEIRMALLSAVGTYSPESSPREQQEKMRIGLELEKGFRTLKKDQEADLSAELRKLLLDKSVDDNTRHAALTDFVNNISKQNKPELSKHCFKELAAIVARVKKVEDQEVVVKAMVSLVNSTTDETQQALQVSGLLLAAKAMNKERRPVEGIVRLLEEAYKFSMQAGNPQQPTEILFELAGHSAKWVQYQNSQVKSVAADRYRASTVFTDPNNPMPTPLAQYQDVFSMSDDIHLKIKALAKMYELAPEETRHLDQLIDTLKKIQYDKTTQNIPNLIKDSHLRRAIAQRMVERADINLPELLKEKNNLLVKMLETATSKLQTSTLFRTFTGGTDSSKILYAGIKEKERAELEKTRLSNIEVLTKQLSALKLEKIALGDSRIDPFSAESDETQEASNEEMRNLQVKITNIKEQLALLIAEQKQSKQSTSKKGGATFLKGLFTSSKLSPNKLESDPELDTKHIEKKLTKGS
jgi:hypothetical protein